MKNLLIVFFLLLSITAFSQFRMVGTATWSTLNDSTYQGTVSFQSDLTGMGYLATHIVDTFRLFTPVEKIYRIDSVWNKTFSSATLRIVEMLGTQGVPVGQVMVFNPDGRNTIPQNPFGSTGATAQLNAAVDTWNARQISTSNIVNNGKCLERQHTQVGHTFSIGDAVFWDADTLKLATVNSLLPAQAVVTGFVPDSDILIIAYTGECETTLTHGFTQDSAYYVSRTGGQPVIEGSKPDTSQYLFRALNDSTIVVAIGNMYLEGLPGDNVATSTYKYCSTGTSCLSDSTYTQIYSTVDTVLLGTPTYNGELRCFDNQTVGSVVLKPENAGTTEIAGDAVYSLPSGQSICFYASPNGPATWNWYIVSEGNVPATPGIDSTFIQSDSVFIAAGGQDYFSGLNYLPSDWGNVLFVSTNGNNSTAVKGDPNKPWADPQAAVNAAMSNDIVWLFPGTWNFGTTGFTVTNLAKEGVTFYMMPGAKLVNVGTTAQTLFSISSTGSYNISGEGYFELGDNDHLIILSDTSFTSNVSFNANGFKSQGGLSSTYRMCTLYGFGTFIFNLDNYEADSVRMYAIDIANVNLTSNKSIAKININNLKHNHNVYSASNTRGVLGIYNTSNTDVILNIGNCVVGNTTQNNTYSFLRFSSLVSIENSNISINIENATFTSKSTSLNNTQYVFFHDYPTNGTNSSFSINLKNCISNMNVLYKGSQIGSSVDSLYTIYFNAKILQTRGSSIITNSSSPNTTFTSIECNVNIINKGTSSPVVLGSNDKIYISGRINSLVSPVDILSANPKLQIQNSVLLTDVANAAINSSATINVNTLNTFTNTLTIDPDVTELIQPITRNSNVK